MDEEHTCGPFPECRTENLSGMDEGGRERAGRDEGVHQIVVLRIEIDRPKMFFVVVPGVQEIAGEEGDGLGRAQELRGWLTRLTVDDPRRELQTVPHRELVASRGCRTGSRRRTSCAKREGGGWAM